MCLGGGYGCAFGSQTFAYWCAYARARTGARARARARARACARVRVCACVCAPARHDASVLYADVLGHPLAQTARVLGAELGERWIAADLAEHLARIRVTHSPVTKLRARRCYMAEGPKNG
eukprot:2970857-Pleurochrysis_carterae.AAC.1